MDEAASQRSFRITLSSLLQGLTELLFLTPIWLTIAIYFFTPITSWIWVFLLLLGYLIPQQLLSSEKAYKNVIATTLVIGIALIITLIINVISSQPIATMGVVLSFLTAAYFIFSSLRRFKYGWSNSFTVTTMVICIIGFVVLQLLKVIWLTKAADHSNLYYLLGIISFIIFLFIANERMLQDQQIAGQSSRTFRMSLTVNRIVIGCISAILLLLTLLREWQKAIEQWIRELIQRIIAWFSGNEPQERTDPISMPPTEIDLGEPAPEKEPSQFWAYVELIMKIVVIVIVAAAILVILFVVVKKLISAINVLIARLTNPFGANSQQNIAYTDEIEELAPVSKLPRKPKRKQRAILDRDWDKLSDEEKVRGLYRQLVIQEKEKGFQVNPSFTAAQTINELVEQRLKQGDYSHTHSVHYEQLKQLYDDARYSNKQINESKIKKIYNFFVAKK